MGDKRKMYIPGAEPSPSEASAMEATERAKREKKAGAIKTLDALEDHLRRLRKRCRAGLGRDDIDRILRETIVKVLMADDEMPF